jgi:hypothetical protein
MVVPTMAVVWNIGIYQEAGHVETGHTYNPNRLGQAAVHVAKRMS